jgi:hypothetical protein
MTGSDVHGRMCAHVSAMRPAVGASAERLRGTVRKQPS